MGKLRILVTDAETPKSLAIVRALGNDHEVWTAADGRLALAAWSRYTQRHLTYGFTRASHMPAWIFSVCRHHNIRIVIPPEESSALLLSREAPRFTHAGIHIYARGNTHCGPSS
jgi:hypothetical protein